MLNRDEREYAAFEREADRMQRHIDELEGALESAKADLAAMERERDELIDALRRCNCQPCDIPACNCGSWHRRPSKADIEIDELRGGL